MREIPKNKLNEKMIKVWRLNGIIETAVVVILTLPVVLILRFVIGMSFFWALAGLALAVFVIDVIIVPPIRYRRWRYDVLDDEVDIYSGIIVRKRVIIPLVRVQFTDTRQGPLMRSCGLAQVSINTAGGEKKIPGLLLADADALRDKVAKLASLAREEV